MKTTVKGLTFNVTIGAAIKGDISIEPSQAQELSTETYKGLDASASVNVSLGLEEASADIVPEEVKGLIDAVMVSAREELELQLRKEELRFKRDELARKSDH